MTDTIPYGRDFWWEERLKASAQADKQPIKEVIQSIAGRPAKPAVSLAHWAVGYGSSVVIPDLNKYRPDYNLRIAKEQMGINHVILRMGGPAQFVADDWLLTEDPTYRSYFSQAKALGYKSIGAYFIYSAGIDAADYARSEILLDFINQCTDNGFMPDYIIADDEVNYWWEHGTKVFATAVNQVKGLRYIMPKIWAKFKRPPMHYSRVTFMQQNAEYATQYITWLDNANGTSMGKTVLNWYAWYINQFYGNKTVFSSQQQILSATPIPTSTQIAAYLQCGSNSLYDLHQLSSTLLSIANKNGTIGVDHSVSRLSEKDFLASINITDTTPPPTPDPVPPGPVPLPKGCSGFNPASVINLLFRP